jgi:hypothetical protein
LRCSSRSSNPERRSRTSESSVVANSFKSADCRNAERRSDRAVKRNSSQNRERPPKLSSSLQFVRFPALTRTDESHQLRQAPASIGSTINRLHFIIRVPTGTLRAPSGRTNSSFILVANVCAHPHWHRVAGKFGYERHHLNNNGIIRITPDSSP